MKIGDKVRVIDKGNCPACGVKTGSNHKKDCMFKKEEIK